MKKQKMNKGITLIALILTIVVLLILAVVAINAVKGDGIIGHAKKAKSEYEKAQETEKDLLSQYEYEIEKNQGQTTESYGEYAINKELNEKVPGLKLGDKVNYVATGTEYTGEWKVLGIEDGQIQIVASYCPTNISFNGSKQNNLWDETTQSYNGAVNELNSKCAEYGNGTGAISARSIKFEDVAKITKGAQIYDPEVRYGDKVTYKVTVDGIQYKVNNDLEYKKVPEEFDVLIMPNEKELQENEEITVETTLRQITVRSGLSEKAKEVLDIDYNRTNLQNIYFLATTSTIALESSVSYGITYAYPRESIYCDSANLWWASTKQDNAQQQAYGIRPVVYLNSNVTLTQTAENSGEWNITQ